MEYEFLDYEGLELYHSGITDYINQGDARSLEEIEAQDERINDIEDSQEGVTKTLRYIRGIIENLESIIEGGVDISGSSRIIDQEPMSGEEYSAHTISSKAVFDSLASIGAYAALPANDPGVTSDPTIDVVIPNYRQFNDSAILFLKTSAALQTGGHTYLRVKRSEDDAIGYKHEIYFNAKPANEENTWEANEIIIAFYSDGKYYSMPARSVASASDIIIDGKTLDEYLSDMEGDIASVKTVAYAANVRSQENRTLINNLSSITNSERIRIEEKVDANTSAIQALSLGARVAVTISPSCIYKGENASVTAVAVFTPSEVHPTTITIKNDTTGQSKSATGVNTVSSADTFNITVNSATFSATAEYDGTTFKANGTFNARYPIYCGFCNINGLVPAYSEITNVSHRLLPRISAAGTYTATATGNGQKYCIMVPSDIGGLTVFTMGGAPVAMATGSYIVGNITYTTYYTEATYDTGGYVDIAAS